MADASEQKAVAVLMNAERAKKDKEPLSHSSQLERVAQAHAKDMVNQKYFSHTAKDGSDVKTRIDRTEYKACAWAENIAHGYEISTKVMNVWMKSKGHRTNILRDEVTQYGIGFHDNYWVMVLAKPC
ncbi:MAG: CAP domain-containing protein [Pseudomonadota bacterium]